MTAAELIERISKLIVLKRGGIMAPHKPLLLLLTLWRVAPQKTRLVSVSEIEKLLRQLLMDFGPRRQSYRPEYPFWCQINRVR
jgi:putative restriction endonuclease